MTRQVPPSKSASKSDLARRRFALMAAEYLQRMGERMAERRKELGLTQEQVARALPGETSGTHVSRWERGLHRPSDDTLEALAKVLKVEVAYFLAAQADKSDGTPDPFAGPSDQAQLDRIEQQLLANSQALEVVLGGLANGGVTEEPALERALDALVQLRQHSEAHRRTG